MRLDPVTGRRSLREFFAAAERIYRDNPRWVPPIRPQVRRWWRDGVRLFVLRDRDGRPVARTTMHTDAAFDAKLGRRCQLFGLTEFASFAAAEALFEAIAAAGRQAGREALFGPVALLPNQAGGVITAGYDERGFHRQRLQPRLLPDRVRTCRLHAPVRGRHVDLPGARIGRVAGLTAAGRRADPPR